MSIILGGGNCQFQRMDETTERLIDAHLKCIDSLLGLEWFPLAAFDEETGQREGRYGLTCRWAQVDKRWELYHAGDIGEPYDILGWFTEAAGNSGDFHEPNAVPVSPDKLLDRVAEFLGKCDNERTPWRDRMRANVQANAVLRETLKRDSRDEMLEGLKMHRRQLGSIPFVGVASDIN